MKKLLTIALVLLLVLSIVACSDKNETKSDEPENTQETSSTDASVQEDEFIKNEWVLIEGGTFEMGAEDIEDAKPVHSVTVSDFSINKYEVTAREYAEFLNAEGNKTEDGVEWLWVNEKSNIEYVDDKYQAREGKENHPVNNVSWYGAKAYAEWVGGRLPTEAEWEYAAGNGTKHTMWSLDKTFSELDYVFKNAETDENTEPVDFGEPNDFGLYNMSGNIGEWCADWYSEDFYAESEENDPVCEDDTSGYRVLRGGSWLAKTKDKLQVAARAKHAPTHRYADFGFRVVRVSE